LYSNTNKEHLITSDVLCTLRVIYPTSVEIALQGVFVAVFPMCCSVVQLLQCFAMCCRVLQCVAVCCGTPGKIAMCVSVPVSLPTHPLSKVDAKKQPHFCPRPFVLPPPPPPPVTPSIPSHNITYSCWNKYMSYEGEISLMHMCDMTFLCAPWNISSCIHMSHVTYLIVNHSASPPFAPLPAQSTHAHTPTRVFCSLILPCLLLRWTCLPQILYIIHDVILSVRRFGFLRFLIHLTVLVL
jgi:hypothetical protein